MTRSPALPVRKGRLVLLVPVARLVQRVLKARRVLWGRRVRSGRRVTLVASARAVLLAMMGWTEGQVPLVRSAPLVPRVTPALLALPVLRGLRVRQVLPVLLDPPDRKALRDRSLRAIVSSCARRR